MTTITAVELRKNMGEIFRRVEKGEVFRVTYRDKVATVLSSPKKVAKKHRMAGLDALDSSPRTPYFDPTKPLKDLYQDSLGEKYGRYM
ncbi:MAG: hypothetical protein WBP23_04140 [Candidatus Saccharimonadales bacterium]